MFEKVWPTIFSRLAKVYLEKSVLDIFTASVVYNELQHYYHTGVALTFTKNGYSKKEAREDISRVFAAFGEDELRFVDKLQVSIHVGDFDDSEVKAALLKGRL